MPSKRTWNPQPDEDEERPEEGRGRSRRSREADAVHDLAVALVELRPAALEALELDEDVAEALTHARRLGDKKRERTARRRQILFLAGILRRLDPEELESLRDDVMSAPKNSPRELALQLVERWRTRIIQDDEAVEELMATHPDADRQRLRQLVRSARKARDPKRAKKASRELFQALKEVMDV